MNSTCGRTRLSHDYILDRTSTDSLLFEFVKAIVYKEKED